MESVLQRFLSATFGPASLKRLAYVACGLPVGVCGFVAVLALVPGLVLSVTVLGLAVVSALVLAARSAGAGHRWLTRHLLGVTITPPAGIDRPQRPISWAGVGLTDATGWRALLYLGLRFPLSIAAFLPTAYTLIWGLLLGSSPVWNGPDATGPAHDNVLTVGGVYFDTWPRVVLLGLAGLALLTAVPWLSWALVWPDIQFQKLLLGPTRADRLRQARAVAVTDAADRLRRIERDLHDGTQAQLVAVAMKLSLAREEMEQGDTTAGHRLVVEAHTDAQRAAVELRDLVRGIHPPSLSRGIQPALRDLVARSGLTVEMDAWLATRPSPAIEALLYHGAAELLTNVAKHAGRRSARLSLDSDQPDRVRLTVRDDGGGGAAATEGGGLAGLADRVSTVDGVLRIDSPLGGPTEVTICVPERI